MPSLIRLGNNPPNGHVMFCDVSCTHAMSASSMSYHLHSGRVMSCLAGYPGPMVLNVFGVLVQCLLGLTKTAVCWFLIEKTHMFECGPVFRTCLIRQVRNQVHIQKRLCFQLFCSLCRFAAVGFACPLVSGTMDKHMRHCLPMKGC